jgi:CRP-like cAMP-binding protein
MPARELALGSPEQIEARFPKLDASQIAGLATFGQQRDAQANEVILERGDLHHGIFVVLSGRIEVVRVSADGETVLHVLGRGEFTGDVNLLSGRGTLIRASAVGNPHSIDIGILTQATVKVNVAAVRRPLCESHARRRKFPPGVGREIK